MLVEAAGEEEERAPKNGCVFCWKKFFLTLSSLLDEAVKFIKLRGSLSVAINGKCSLQ